MIKKSNLVFIVISLLPIIVLPFIYNKLIPFPNTKISGGNGIVLNKAEFVFVIFLICFVGYIISVSASKLSFLSSLFNPVFVRVFVNCLFTIATIVLLFSNTH